MKKFVLSFLFLATISSYSQTNISFIGQLDYQSLHNAVLSNLWGYTDENGNEYAIVGTEKGVSVVDLSTPSNPIEIFWEPGTTSIWREVKTWGDYAYITTEANDGMMIIDLSPLPLSTTLPVTYFNGPVGNQWTSAHSLFIDENGILYLHGTNRGNGGVIFYDLNTSATNPTEVGEFDTWYVHDSYARGDTLYAAHINNGFFTIVDVSNKANPVVMGVQNTPHNFTHNTWLSDNGQFLFTTDEVSGAYVAAYDITDPLDILEVDRIQNAPGTGVIPHNTYYLNGYLITSYYRSGVIIHDAQYPNMLVEVGNYDTAPQSGNGFNGAWGVYPFFSSGNLIVSDIEQGLFVLGPNYQRGCYLNGNVTDASNSQTISGASVEILTLNINESTDVFGDYGTGTYTPGTYSIRFTKAGYYDDTVFNVILSSNTITTVDAQLTPLPSFTLTGNVYDNATSNGIPNAKVKIWNGLYLYDTITDGSGNFSIPAFHDDIYNITVGKWGYVTSCLTNVSLTTANNTISIGVDAGIYDDFTFDYGWTESGAAISGNWERDVPIGTTQGPNTYNPNEDVTTDCSDLAFVTGNGGGSAGSDDVDEAETVLTSPVFDLTGYGNPYLNYARWFANGGGSGQPNDSLQIFLNNGTTTATIEICTATSTTQFTWVTKSFKISDFITPSATMQMIVYTADWQAQGGHLLEAGLDEFYITDGGLSVDEKPANENIRLFPNPNTGSFTIQSSEAIQSVMIIDITGRIVYTYLPKASIIQLDLKEKLDSGVYTLIIETENGNFVPLKMIIEK